MTVDEAIMRLRERRGGLGLSYRELAERTGLSYAYIHRVLNGKADPSLASLRKLAAAMGLDIDLKLKPSNGGDR